MRFGVTAESQTIRAEERRQSRRVVLPGGEGLDVLPPVYVDDLTQDIGGGVSEMTFIFGLHDPFDPNTERMLTF